MNNELFLKIKFVSNVMFDKFKIWMLLFSDKYIHHATTLVNSLINTNKIHTSQFLSNNKSQLMTDTKQQNIQNVKWQYQPMTMCSTFINILPGVQFCFKYSSSFLFSRQVSSSFLFSRQNGTADKEISNDIVHIRHYPKKQIRREDLSFFQEKGSEK